MKKSLSIIIFITLTFALTFAMSACGSDEKPVNPSAGDVGISPSDVSGGDISGDKTEDLSALNSYKNKDRYETRVNREGDTETVKCERFITETYGISYFYEYFIYSRSDGKDMFRWYADDADSPRSYVLINAAPGVDAKEMAGNIGAGLRMDFENVEESQSTIGRYKAYEVSAFDCMTDSYPADTIIRYFVVPQSDGCRLIEMHYFTEASEGIGSLMVQMFDSFTVNAK